MSEASNVVPFIPNIPCGPGNLKSVRALTTLQLKHMWDDSTGRYEHLWDEIHLVMNERGEGSYVAV